MLFHPRCKSRASLDTGDVYAMLAKLLTQPMLHTHGISRNHPENYAFGYG